jgi:hypothetical protein
MPPGLRPLLAYARKLTLVKGNAALYAARGQALRETDYAPLLGALARP